MIQSNSTSCPERNTKQKQKQLRRYKVNQHKRKAKRTALSQQMVTRLSYIRAASWQNQQNGMCAQWRLRSAEHSPSLIRDFAVHFAGRTCNLCLFCHGVAHRKSEQLKTNRKRANNDNKIKPQQKHRTGTVNTVKLLKFRILENVL